MDETIVPPIQTSLRPPQKRKRFGKIIYILLFFILTGVVIGAGIRLTSFLGKEKESNDITIVTLSPTETLFPTDTPSPSPTEQSKPTSKPTPKSGPTVTPTPKKTTNTTENTTSLDRSALSVAVFNGNNVTGAASKMSTFLKELGYSVSSVGNADTFDYKDVTILIKVGKKDYLPLLKKDLEGTYTIGLTSEDLTASSSADAHIIVGK